MKEALKKAMTTSISEVLETMFFMTIDVNENAATEAFLGKPGEHPFASRIYFQGKLSGYFLLMIPEEILRVMTETFMGVDAADVTVTHLNGTIQEAINMIAGNTFSTFDNTAVFDLGIPELIDFNLIPSRCPKETPEDHFLLVETFAGNLGLKICFTTE
ncbi:MAG: chemotaxis protein CheX [Desulfobacterales bacterium]|jgi:CheY-specific phosphatase CheX|nr:chemotaxis protein CheX [Desulfobacterales bacterium]